MSGWLVAVREVYAAGGRMLVADMTVPLDDIVTARRRGMLEAGHKGFQQHWAILTRTGRDFCEGRAELYVPSFKSSTGGRAPGTHRRLRATWLASLPQTNEIRL